MRTRHRVVADGRFQDLSETGVAQHDDMIETLAANRADEPFDVRVLPGRARCREHFLGAHGFDDGLNRLKRAIADKIPWRLVSRKGFPELLRGPRGRRMPSHGGVHDAPAVMTEDHQHEQQSARCRRHHEEIGRDDLVDMIGQKRAPRLRGRTSSLRHVLGDRRLSDVDPELHELTVNTWRSPQRILLRHRPTQRADVGRNGGSTRTVPTLPRPEQAEASAVPGEDGLWLHDDDRRSPSLPHSRQPDPEQSVRSGEPHAPRACPFKDLELMSQREDLELQRGS